MAKELMPGRRGCFYIMALIRRLDGRTRPEIIFYNFTSACTLAYRIFSHFSLFLNLEYMYDKIC